jgi:hypothetical protein
MIKKKTQLKNLGKETTRLHLRRLYPFLKQEFRTITKKEIDSEKVFKELFGEVPFDSNLLQILFAYQN